MPGPDPHPWEQELDVNDGLLSELIGEMSDLIHSSRRITADMKIKLEADYLAENNGNEAGVYKAPYSQHPNQGWQKPGFKKRKEKNYWVFWVIFGHFFFLILDSILRPK